MIGVVYSVLLQIQSLEASSIDNRVTRDSLLILYASLLMETRIPDVSGAKKRSQAEV